MSSDYTTTIQQRRRIHRSHLLLSRFMSLHTINQLLHIFDPIILNDDVTTHHIRKYILNENTKQGINMNKRNLSISTVVSDPANNPTCIAKILYHGRPFLHLSIHLAPTDKEIDNHGMIHLVKDYYCVGRKVMPIGECRVRIKVTSIDDKPGSLSFELNDDIPPPADADTSMEPIMKTEMDILMTVLNRLFNQNEPWYYVGTAMPTNHKLVNMNKAAPLLSHHPGTNPSAMRINGLMIPRKNTGLLLPSVVPPVLPAPTAASAAPSRRRLFRRITHRSIMPKGSVSASKTLRRPRNTSKHKPFHKIINKIVL
jgi:hypothetical protein